MMMVDIDRRGHSGGFILIIVLDFHGASRARGRLIEAFRSGMATGGRHTMP